MTGTGDRGLSPEARALLDAARREISPSAADRARVRRAVAVGVGGAAAVAAGTALASSGVSATSAGASATTVGSVSLLVKVGVALTIVAATATGATLVVKHSLAPTPPGVAVADAHHAAHHAAHRAAHAASASSVVAPAPVVVPAPIVAPEAPPAALPAELPQAPSLPMAPPHAHGAHATHVVAHETGDATQAAAVAMPAPIEVDTDTLMSENALLDDVNAALRHRDSATALARVAEHESRYPHGTLVQEFAAARVLALCAAGRVDEARGAAEMFRASYPGSPQIPHIDESCAGAE